MGRSREQVGWLAGKVLARPAGFRGEYLDFDRGIRVGHLEPEERITQIFKGSLAERHGIRFICDRWGRGVHWQWICWVPEPNRNAKPLSSGYNFASAKYFVGIDLEDRLFQSGVQVERAPVEPGEDDWQIRLEKDWDWHTFLRALRGEALPRILVRLLREGFRIRAGPFHELAEFHRRNWDLGALRRKVGRFSRRDWGGFQLYWPMREREVQETPGPEIIDAIQAVFDELAPAMNHLMTTPCLREREGSEAE